MLQYLSKMLTHFLSGILCLTEMQYLTEMFTYAH